MTKLCKFDNKSNCMFVHPRSSLIHNRGFRVAFTIGLIAALTGIVISVVFAANGDNCVDMNYCSRNYYDYTNTCIESSTLYCCSSYKSGSYSCGSYYRSCKYEYYGYTDCTSFIIGRAVTGGIAFVCLIVMILIASHHKRKMNDLWMRNNMRQNQNVIFTDRINPPQRPQPIPIQPIQPHLIQRQPIQPVVNNYQQPLLVEEERNVGINPTFVEGQ